MNDKLIEFFGWTKILDAEHFSTNYYSYWVNQYPEEYPVFVRGNVQFGDTPEESYYEFDFMYPAEIEMFIKNNPEVLK